MQRNYLKIEKQRTLLIWWHTGRKDNGSFSHTRCEVVKQETIQGCDIALAEDCWKQDSEDIEEGEVIEGQAKDAQPSNTGGSLA